MQTMDSTVQQIKEKIDIVDFIRSYIPLIPAGKNFKAVCPFHKEKTPSFIVSPDRQTWHCFGSCNEGGDVFKFLMKYENLEFYEALKILAEKAGIELRRLSPADQKQFGVLYDLNHLAKEFFKKSLWGSRETLDYVKSRGLTKETVDEFELGLAPHGFDNLTVHLLNLGFDVRDIERAGLIVKTEKGRYIDRFHDRLMFPIYNSFGKVVGFTGRILPQFDTGEMGKYVNSPETPIFNKSKILYGFHKTKQPIKDSRRAVLVEGQMDFLMLYQDGVKNAIATSGTALTADHLTALRRFADDLILAFDNDDAGHKATERSIDLANSLDFSVRTITIGDFKDPAEVVQKHPGKIKEFIHEAAHAMKFYFERYLGLGDKKKDIGELKKDLRMVLQKIKIMSSPVEQAYWVRELANFTGISEPAIVEEMNKLKSVSRFESLNRNAEKALPKSAGTRRDMLVERLITILVSHEDLRPKFKDYAEYVPTAYIGIVEQVLQGREGENEALGILNLQSSLNEVFEVEKIIEEFNNLLLELKLEYFREERESILAALKVLEKKGDEVEMGALLQRFDEISKLMHNVR